MSYFMTVSGAITPADIPATAHLLPARSAQAYIENLEPMLAKLDGEPVFLIEDGESGTSHNLVSEVGDALVEDRPLEEVPLTVLLNKCFRNKWSFRVWLADNDPQAHVKNTITVSSLAEVLGHFQHNRVCVCWHAS